MFLKILFLLAAVSQVWCQCRISNDVLLNSNHTFAVQQDKDKPLSILNSNLVQNGAILNMICDRSTAKARCDGKTFSPKLETVAPCSKYAQPVLIKNRRDAQFNCDIYDMTLPYYDKKVQYLTVYQSCYDSARKTPVYTQHFAYPIFKRHPRPNVNFKASAPALTDSNARLTARRIYDVFQKLYGDRQSYMKPNQILINRGHLVPSSAFAYGSQQVTTFNFINVVPQFAAINSGNWLIFENYVSRYLARPSGTKVTTGAIGVLELENTAQRKFFPLYLANDKQMPTPKWTYMKIEGHDLVYLMYNSLIDADKVPQPKCGAVSECGVDNLLDRNTGGYYYCCKAQDFEVWFKNEMKI